MYVRGGALVDQRAVGNPQAQQGSELRKYGEVELSGLEPLTLACLAAARPPASVPAGHRPCKYSTVHRNPGRQDRHYPPAPRTARALALAVSKRAAGPCTVKPIGPHTLRHVFIPAALDAGVPLETADSVVAAFGLAEQPTRSRSVDTSLVAAAVGRSTLWGCHLSTTSAPMTFAEQRSTPCTACATNTPTSTSWSDPSGRGGSQS